MKRWVFVATLASLLWSPAVAGPEEDLLRAAKAIYDTAGNQDSNLQKLTYESVRDILDRIVEEYPASDIAVRILLKDTIDGIDVAALDAALQASSANDEETNSNQVSRSATVESDSDNSASPADPSTSQPVAPGASDNRPLELSALPLSRTSPEEDPIAREEQQSQGRVQDARNRSSAVGDGQGGQLDAGAKARALPPGTEESESVLELDKQGIRDVQARLLVQGHDPNGIDGVIGRGTRSAIRSWQRVIGADPTGFLNQSQLAALKELSQSALDQWLLTEENAKLYEPPPPIAIGPGNMGGTWRYTSNCGSRSRLGEMRITGVMSLRHSGGNTFTGSLTNSQGLRANLNARLRGRNVSGIANFGFLFGRVELSARVDDQALVLRGRDSNGCSFLARKS